jgi:hypothetical protein
MGMSPRSGLYGIVADSEHGPRAARSMERQENSPKGAKLETSDERPGVNYKIYVYNLLDMEHIVEQPPVFPRFVVPACPRGERFSVTTLPAFVKERYERPGSTEYYYKEIDGRKYATSLLNPGAYPGTLWQAQTQDWRSNDQFGNNLNAIGVFWSMKAPNDPELEKEIQIMKGVCLKTMNALVRKAEQLYNSKKEAEITPLQHFAMDYLHKQAPWHLQSDRMVDCPTCGEPVKEGIAYHRNSFGEKCPVDYEKCRELGIIPKLGPADVMPPNPSSQSQTQQNVSQMEPQESEVDADPEDELEAVASTGASKESARVAKEAGATKKKR